uniref:Uncharacterized protein n=1 Tax=Vitrella brassicaformis TaxID=1169539 RepID=A0A6U4C9C0_9ALVE|mmetsp:Transcript_25583/g.63371  ORF Transcript_25583/g.63371 Transcript_25583/m.63371 type:complete len:528 (+) Transcript_25583:1663-3246(+)
MDEALATATANTDRLRNEIEEQRRRLCESNERELALCRTHYEEKFQAAAHAHEIDMNDATQQLKAHRDENEAKSGEISGLKQVIGRLETDNCALQRDITQAKAQCDKAHQLRQAADEDLAKARQHWSRERSALQSDAAEAKSQLTSLQGQLQMAEQELRETKLIRDKVENEWSARKSLLETKLDEKAQALKDAQASLMDVQQALHRERNNLIEQQRRLAEMNAQLQWDIESRDRLADEERYRAEDSQQTLRAKLATAKEQYDTWKEAHIQAIKKMQEESQLKLGSAERERCRHEEHFARQLQDTSSQMQQLQQKNEWLEKDLQRTHYLLEETQENMRFLSAGKERSDQALARQQAQLEAALSQVQMRRDGDGKITKELEKVTRERDALRRELEESKQSTATQAQEAEGKAKRLISEYEQQLQWAEKQMQVQIDKERDKLDKIIAEKSSLKRYMGESRTTAHGLTLLQRQLEQHIHQLQQHADDLREDIVQSARISPRSRSPLCEPPYTRSVPNLSRPNGTAICGRQL